MVQKYGPVFLLNFGNACALTGFACSDFLALRLLALVATSCGVIYNVTHNPPLKLPACWGLVFLSVNGWMTFTLLRERGAEISFTKEELAVFEEHFLPYGVSPIQFRKLMDQASWVDVPAGVLLATEGQGLSSLMLIAEGRVEASVASGVPVSSFSTFPGARMLATNNGIDSAAWVGEISFLETGKAQGCIATFTTASPVRFLRWDNAQLRQALRQDHDLESSVTRAITGALVGKIMRFTSETGRQNVEAYCDVLTAVLVDSVIDPAEKRLLREYREKYHVTDDMHRAALERLGWSVEEFEDGCKQSAEDAQAVADAVRKINATLIRRATMLDGAADDLKKGRLLGAGEGVGKAGEAPA